MKADSGYILIPDEIVERKDLTPLEKLMLGQLARLQGKKACCFPSYAYLAAKCGISERQAIRVVGQLSEKKEILLLHHNRKSNTYSVPWKTARNVRRAWAERRAAQKAVAS